MNFTRGFPRKKIRLPKDAEGTNSLQNYEDNSQGSTFVIMSCQRLHLSSMKGTGADVCVLVNDLDGPIRADRFADSRESLGSRTEPPSLRIAFPGMH